MGRRLISTVVVATVGVGLILANAGCESGSASGGPGLAGRSPLGGLSLGNWGQGGAAAAGAVAGAAVGAQVDGEHRQAAMAAGGLLGAWAGNALYAKLTAQDREVLIDSTETTATTGEGQTYKNPETGVQIDTRVAEQQTRQETVALPVLKERVEQVPPLDLIGETYQAAASTDVRSGPGADYKTVAQLSAGQQVQVIGKVQSQPWLMIGEGGAASGFTEEKSLAPVAGGASVLAPVAADASATPPASPPAAATETAQVQVERDYRTVEQKVALPDGSVHTEQVTVRQGPNGWEIQ